MPTFYRGIGVGTYWDPDGPLGNDPRLRGFQPQAPGVTGKTRALINHITRGTTNSPFVSLTLSYGVAKMYAFSASRARPTATHPARIYEIDLDDPLPAGIELLDPVLEIAEDIKRTSSFPGIVPYQHDGAPEFLVGVAGHGLWPRLTKKFLTNPRPVPPGAISTTRPPNLSGELEALVRALRDAEVLVAGTIPFQSIGVDHKLY